VEQRFGGGLAPDQDEGGRALGQLWRGDVHPGDLAVHSVDHIGLDSFKQLSGLDVLFGAGQGLFKGPDAHGYDNHFIEGRHRVRAGA